MNRSGRQRQQRTIVLLSKSTDQKSPFWPLFRRYFHRIRAVDGAGGGQCHVGRCRHRGGDRNVRIVAAGRFRLGMRTVMRRVLMMLIIGARSFFARRSQCGAGVNAGGGRAGWYDGKGCGGSGSRHVGRGHVLRHLRVMQRGPDRGAFVALLVTADTGST